MAVTMGEHALNQMNVDVLQGGVVVIVTTVRIILNNDHYEYCIHFNKDINECSNGKNNCDHKCHNTQGSYTCSCNDGYELGSDHRACEGMYMYANVNKYASIILQECMPF